MKVLFSLIFIASLMGGPAMATPSCLRLIDQFLETQIQKSPALSALEEIHPTQFDYGLPRIKFLKNKFKEMDQEQLQAYLDQKPIPYVLGPDQRKYIIDHHHLSLALHEHLAQNPRDELVVSFKQVEDYSRLTRSQFWQKMQQNKYVYAKRKGVSLGVETLPSHISELKKDFYRGMAWVLIKADIIEKSPQPFAEFLWADQMRAHSRLDQTKWNLESIVEVFESMKSSPEKFEHLPGYKKITQSQTELISALNDYLPLF